MLLVCNCDEAQGLKRKAANGCCQQLTAQTQADSIALSLVGAL
jgi:hypothetical protein